ncbi:AlpA family phage regulatory protein [Duganella sp. CY42W]|uniref:AlpA family phage regulatory protein n=2 Tax=Duganella levis TaxID=2692169 RepID=A0ABW9W3H6_9BURK|nr:AlpA family phage regulatory protein [Duganella levis]
MATDLIAKHTAPQQGDPNTPSAIAARPFAAQHPGLVLINRKQLLQKVPLSERTILDMEKRGEFPRRFAISARHVAWDLQEVDQWIQRRRQTAGQLQAPGTDLRTK